MWSSKTPNLESRPHGKLEDHIESTWRLRERLSAIYLDLSFARTHNILGKRVVRCMEDTNTSQKNIKKHDDLYIF